MSDILIPETIKFPNHGSDPHDHRDHKTESGFLADMVNEIMESEVQGEL